MTDYEYNKLEAMKEIALDLFLQGVGVVDGKYDHMCISSYEYAQKVLIEYGMIKKEDCYRD